MTRSTVQVATSDGGMPAHLWLPEAGSGPGILLLQEIFGVSDYVERRAQDLADLGYVVLAPEIFWRLGVGRVETGPQMMEQGYDLLMRLDWPQAVADGVAGLDLLRAHPAVAGGVGIVGFCFGGGLGYAVAAPGQPAALVSYYGSALPELLGLAPEEPGIDRVDPADVAMPSLHHFGAADSFLQRPVVEAVRDVLVQQPSVTFELYERGDHAFDNDDFALYGAEESALAWQRTADFLARHLPTA